ncbi:MAG: hypothetical protein QOI55_1301, partial [Actinomycetota bacterium]|nr:hypothetical protein [Actinomycetota bacterium]
VGVMYMNADRPGPQIGGPLTVWHTHCQQRMPCITANGRLVPAEAAHCRLDQQAHDWMLHVWLVPNPGGVFAFEMVSPTAGSS